MSELSELKARRESVIAELKEIESVIDEGRSRILEAIKSQRWYFFRDNKYILMDKVTGLLWANLENFDPENKGIGYFDNISGVKGWDFPSHDEFCLMIEDKTFPFWSGENWRISRTRDWLIAGNGKINLDDLSAVNMSCVSWQLYKDSPDYLQARLLPCNRSLVDASHNYSTCTEDERAQFTLDLFVKNRLCPQFNDDSIIELYSQYIKEA